MQSKEKIALCAVPYLIAGVLWFVLAAPAVTEDQTQSSELSAKRKEHTELVIKLTDAERVREEHKQLQDDIAQLRAAVPKSPDVDLLLIDLEKMCLDAGLDIISVEEPDREKLKQIGVADESETEGQDIEQASLINTSLINKGKALAKAAKPPENLQKPKVTEPVESGLEKKILQVAVAGSYPNCIELMRKLEKYQRVIGIMQLEIGFPSEGKSEAKQDSQALKTTFVVTAYYLP